MVDVEASELEAEFLQRACIFSWGDQLDAPRKWRSARRLLERNPALTSGSIHAAAVSGDDERVAKLLRDDPNLVHASGGRQQWTPLLFVCYGRLGTKPVADNSLSIARRLLDAGADPNSHFITDDDWRLRFTALTGAMGGGEMGQPAHVQGEALARLLLERGADPNDGQGLYNTHLGSNDDTKWLELLFEFGLTGDSPVNWHAEAANAEKSGADKVRSIADYLLAQAVDRGETKRARILLEHGADANARSMYTNRSCYAMALMGDHQEILELLRARGATSSELEGHDAFVAACHRDDRELVRELVAQHPEYLEDAQPLVDAARAGNLQVLRLLLDLGMDANGEDKHGQRALHNAAKNQDASQLLLDHGADESVRCYGGTPAQWAILGDDVAMARFHAERSRYLLDAVISGHVELARELLQEDPTRSRMRSPYGDTPLHLLPADPAWAEPLATTLLDAGAELDAMNDNGQTPLNRLRELGAYDAADLLERGA